MPVKISSYRKLLTGFTGIFLFFGFWANANAATYSRTPDGVTISNPVTINATITPGEVTADYWGIDLYPNTYPTTDTFYCVSSSTLSLSWALPTMSSDYEWTAGSVFFTDTPCNADTVFGGGLWGDDNWYISQEAAATLPLFSVPTSTAPVLSGFLTSTLTDKDNLTLFAVAIALTIIWWLIDEFLGLLPRKDKEI